MSNALIYCQSGGGKTCNSTLVKAPKRGKNLLICTDNSSIVLQNFDRPNLEIINVSTVKEFVEAYRNGYESQKYDNIILDNLSDLIDMWLLELDDSGKFRDFRQAYQLVYQSLKRLSREIKTRLQPKIPAKILDNVCGLMNVVAYISTANDKDGNKRWYYVTDGTPTLMAKDQIACRKNCMPEDIFTISKK